MGSKGGFLQRFFGPIYREVLTPFGQTILFVMEPIGRTIGNIVNWILLLATYVIGIGIVALPSKLLGKQYLDLGDKEKETYYTAIDIRTKKLDEYKNQF
ncbi:hypothetical protein COY28_00575 [Candidatus Woesearchaeota archaeon CG_4_10_14_0_2_um_filter_57_5]|nr:MAG: hypothetical protein AUJ68_05525 [Candidatus Woesearchaeota archaeon CG1_02_57_44]PIN68264.1 MAG: hypothetical protein COV94_05620 [Candidatus Woesearchaeota archaeon CG11_big_fil_rev_8_21_14_0_20_57_5]PIZ56872.1 MAG: hypothetical protein COY28_00575 [Candidatus Woesearchaeota archaeon CG_4_10_14_0_2_um_filter_57_5]